MRAPARKKAAPRKKMSVLLRLRRSKKRGNAREAERIYALELLENVRKRYEETPEGVGSLAADLGIHSCNFYRLAKSRGWVRRNPPQPRPIPQALKILEEARALEAAAANPGLAMSAAAPQVALPPRSGGEGRPPQAVGVGGSSAPTEAPPTPDPSPAFAARMGGGERAESAAAVGPRSAAELSGLSTIERLERAVLAELATIEAMRAAMGTLPQKPPGAALTVRTLAQLTQTLQHLQRLRASAMLSTRPQTKDRRDDDDDMPRDLDEFRRELARRIDAFVASRADDEEDRDDPQPAAPGLAEA